MTWTHRREQFRAILAGSACHYPASVFDPISARAADALGFEVAMFAGSVASMAVLGDPDIVLLTLTEFAGQAHRVCRAAKLPLLVDADHGYGNALNVMRTVEELEVAGVAALTIEDTELPRSFGQKGGPRLVPREEGVGKIKAALAARRDPLLAVVGRTSAVAIAGMDEAILRGKAYEEAGADALFFTGIRTRDELETLRAATSAPLILGGGELAALGLDYLGANGVRICLQGHQPFLAAMNAAYETLRALRNGTVPAELAGVAPAALMKSLTRSADFAEWSAAFLKSEGEG